MLVCVLLFALIPRCFARKTNVTVDDTYGDERTGVVPLYSGNWVAHSPIGNVDPEFTVAVVGRTYNQTIHECLQYASLNKTIHDPSMSLTFNGTAIYIFNFRDTGFADSIKFYLDGSSVGQRIIGPALANELLYDQLMFKIDNLLLGEHTLQMNVTDSAAFFDYAIYTAEDEDPSGTEAASEPASHPSPSGGSVHPSRTHSTPVRTIVGASFAGGAIAIGICALFLTWNRRRRRRLTARAAELARDGEIAPLSPLLAALPPSADQGEKNGKLDVLEATIIPFFADPHTGHRPAVPKDKTLFGDPGARILEDNPQQLFSAVPPHGSRRSNVRAQIERVRAENETARAQIEQLRQTVEPPPYDSNNPSSETGDAQRSAV